MGKETVDGRGEGAVGAWPLKILYPNVSVFGFSAHKFIGTNGAAEEDESETNLVFMTRKQRDRGRL